MGTISSLVFSENQLWGSFTGGTIRYYIACWLFIYDGLPKLTGLMRLWLKYHISTFCFRSWDMRSGQKPVCILQGMFPNVGDCRKSPVLTYLQGTIRSLSTVSQLTVLVYLLEEQTR